MAEQLIDTTDIAVWCYPDVAKEEHHACALAHYVSPTGLAQAGPAKVKAWARTAKRREVERLLDDFPLRDVLIA